ncbi:unnamed protein product [Auanema sp. JU1783]|nr:unnamed protein product [Auanema sp. JU1783]
MSVAFSLKSKKESNRRKLMFRTEAMEAASSLELDDINFAKAVELYKLDSLECKLHDPGNSKPMNCRDNPYCINRLGLDKFMKLLKEEQQRNDKVLKGQKRRDTVDMPCGLVNTGNYCYVNSFLQVWFNDPGFRQIIFDWRNSSSYERPEPPYMDVESVMSSLQRLFFIMQTTPYFSTDENSAFINSLRLDNEQQDAQEFTLVMFDALDRNLLKHPNGEGVRQAIKDRFTGLIRQRLFCTCPHKDSYSETPFNSIQLTIGESKTLTEALTQYLSAEVLEDYRCDFCQKAGTVKRQASIEKLPEVLMIQLTRYVYDATGRKKLKTPISYPKELSSSILVSKGEEFKYELFAVMIHEGNNAHYGHYYDLVKNPTNGNWYRYNDEKVEKIKSPGSCAPPPQRPTVDMKACYGLLYRKKRDYDDFILPPKEISCSWESKMENLYTGQTLNAVEKSEFRLTEVKERFAPLEQLFNSLKAHSGKFKKPRDIVFIPLSLLSDVLAKEYDRIEALADSINEMKPIEGVNEATRRRLLRKSLLTIPNEQVAEQLEKHTLSLCVHGRIDIDSVLYGEVKAVSRLAAETLLTRYAISVTKQNAEGTMEKTKLPNGCEICVECCKQLKREGHFNKQLGDGIKLANKIIREKWRCSLSKTPKPEGFLYVSKKCLQHYRRLATQEMEFQQSYKENKTLIIFSAHKLLNAENSSFDKVSKLESRSRKRPIDSVFEASGKYRVIHTENEITIDGNEDKTVSEQTENNDISDAISSEIIDTESLGEDSETKSRSPSSSDKDFKSGPIEHPIVFNDLLKCPHDGINVSEFRMAVSPQEFNDLVSLFSSSVQVSCTDEICQECLKLEAEAQCEKEKCDSQTRQYCSKFSEILRKIERRKPNGTDEICCRGVCSLFLQKLKSTCRRPKDAGLGLICQEHLLCKHGLPYKKIAEFSGEKQDLTIVPVTLEEWQSFVEAWKELWPNSSPQEIVLNDGGVKEFCVECANEEDESQEKLLYEYSDMPIYIKLQNDGDESEESTELKISRRVRAKNFLKVKMSGKDEVLTLKVKLYKETGQSPNDQLLYSAVGGCLLDDSTTLQDAKILPNNYNNPLVLITQSYQNVSSTESETHGPERGFLDTALAH